MVVLIELASIIICARNLTELHCNFYSHLVAHNKVHCLSLDSHIVVVMELLNHKALLPLEYVNYEALHLNSRV
jgi:hypothetical protein